MGFKLSETEDARAFWFYRNERYNYIAIDETIKGNKDANTLRVTLRDREKSPDEDVEIIFVQDDNGFHFRQEDNEGEYSLRMFESEDEIVLYYEDTGEQEIIYFHLS